MIRVSDADHEKVTGAVAAAEARSAGEIVTVMTEKSDSYHDVALHYAIVGMLAVPAILAFVPAACIEAWMRPLVGWNETLGHGAAMVLVILAQALAFLLIRYALSYMPLRVALTPPQTKTRRALRRAIELFRVGAEQRTTGRTGVLLYLSLLEHRAELVADEAIHAKVDPAVWGDAMRALIDEVKAGRPADGMARAVEMVGDVLAEHLPRRDDDQNELPDRLIEL